MSLYDSVTAANEPAGPSDFGAGYGDGLYDNWAQVVARFGSRAVLEVDVNPADNVGNCLDIEPGDAGPADAPPWTARARARGVNPVWNYCDLSEWPDVIRAHFAAGSDPTKVLWWVADYTNTPHLPSVVVNGVTFTASACQYSGGVRAQFDTSCFKAGIFDSPPGPAPAAPSTPGDIDVNNIVIVRNAVSGLEVVYNTALGQIIGEQDGSDIESWTAAGAKSVNLAQPAFTAITKIQP